MKECELCNSPARMICESDQASLCWECDSKVHSANFLVARHPRNLLCHVCQTKTPWQASGSRLGPTVTICERCVKRGDDNDIKEDADESRNDDDDDDEEEDQEEEDDESDDDDGGDDGEESGDIENNDEDGDNQVVPWSSSTDNPPPGTSSSSSEESSSRFRTNPSLKRTRDDDNLEDDDLDLCGRSRTVDSVRPCHDRTRRIKSIRRLEEILMSRDVYSNLARSK